MGLEAFRKAESAESQLLILGHLLGPLGPAGRHGQGSGGLGGARPADGSAGAADDLNTLVRHGVLGPEAGTETIDYVAARLADAEEIRRSRQFPYQFLAAYLNADEALPQQVKAALHTAAQNACGNVPELPGPVVIGLDVSGSMGSAVTGQRGRGPPSKMRCVDVAALFAAAILRRNPESIVIPFDTRPTRPVSTRATRSSAWPSAWLRYGGGGTNCALPLAVANKD